MKCWVDVLVPGRHVERFRLPEAGATVGSGRNADIRIGGVAGLLDVHCHLRPTENGCAVELDELAREPFSYHGKPSRGCVVGWGEDLFFGSLRLSVSAEGRLGATQTNRSPVLYAALVALPLIAAMSYLAPDEGSDRPLMTEEPPALFGQLPPCTENSDGAVARGLVAEQLALSKHERGVFELEDSVDAVELMREAAACYALGDNQGASDRALDRAEEWIADLQFSYKRALLDLEIGRRAHDGKQVLAAIRNLQVLLGRAAPSAEPYKQRLSALRLSVVASIEEARRQAETK